MKKWMLILCLAMIGFLVGCEELEKAGEFIQTTDYYITDPNSPVQITAEQLEDLVAAAVTAVAAIPGFPYAKVILGALAVANAAIALILKMRKETTEKTLSAVVKAVEDNRKCPAKKNVADKRTNTTVGELIKEDVAANLQLKEICRQGKAIIQDAKNYS